jgi:hypothetical protein
MAGRSTRSLDRTMDSLHGSYWQWRRRERKCRWPVLSEEELRVVIHRAASRERVKQPPRHLPHRATRRAAVALYLRRFGAADFLDKYSGFNMPRLGKRQPSWKQRLRGGRSAV